MNSVNEKDWIQMKIKSSVMAIDLLNQVMKMMLDHELTTLWLSRNRNVIIIKGIALVSEAQLTHSSLKIPSKIKLQEQVTLGACKATPCLRPS
jgi:hypothetical protein